MADIKVDVFISGAGPVGLLLAYQLKRLGISVYIIDAANKAEACTLYPRSCEILDQMDLFDDMSQVAVCARRGFTYRDGKRVSGRGWSIFEQWSGKTFFDFALNIRLRYSEDIFRAKLAEMGVHVQAPSKLETFKLDPNAEDDHQITAKVSASGREPIEVKAKYIIGCDGGRSTVRQTADIPFLGERHTDHWVRIDGIVKSNIPEARLGFGAIESKTHGQVLWVALDHGATRIGYALSPALYEKYGTQMTAAEAVEEAKQACAPFEVEFEEVHWHTVYGIQQHLAERFQDRERILIAGEAAHTHSSATAQGMNTGIHDVSSMSWRLAGVLNGLYKPEVLAAYSTERHASATQLINNDKIASTLIAGKKPESLKNDGRDVMVLLDEAITNQAAFASGLGITYKPSFLNDVEGSYPPINVTPGHRAPDVLIHKPGMSCQSTRLYEVTKHHGKFHILVFAGVPADTRTQLQTLRQHVDDQHGRFDHAVDFVTLIAGTSQVIDEHLGVPRFGKGYWDVDHSAHAKYGVPTFQGAIVVLRPDGIMGFNAPLDEFRKVAEYLDRSVVSRKMEANGAQNGHATKKELGQFLGQNEDFLAMPTAASQSREEGMVLR